MSTTKLEYQIECPNHPKFDKTFTNPFFAEQALSRHNAEPMPKGKKAQLVTKLVPA